MSSRDEDLKKVETLLNAGRDFDDDGIGDTPYIITGTAGSQDNYPIWDDGIETPLSLIDEVNSLVDIGVLNTGQANGLIVKLKQAIRKISQGKINVACNLLQAFINQVYDFINTGVISQEEGELLILIATNIIISLSDWNINLFYKLFFLIFYIYGTDPLDDSDTLTPVGRDISITDDNTGISLTFQKVGTQGATTIEYDLTPSGSPSGIVIAGLPGALSITTTATFLGYVEIAIPYNDNLISNEYNLNQY